MAFEALAIEAKEAGPTGLGASRLQLFPLMFLRPRKHLFIHGWRRSASAASSCVHTILHVRPFWVTQTCDGRSFMSECQSNLQRKEGGASFLSRFSYKEKKPSKLSSGINVTANS